jgi:hypothetical protein
VGKVAHSGIHNGHTRLPLLPGFKPVGSVVPTDGHTQHTARVLKHFGVFVGHQAIVVAQ